MSYTKLTVKTEEIQVGDVQIRVKGYSGNLNVGDRVEYEVVSISEGSHPKNASMVGYNFKLRDRKTNRCKTEFQFPGQSFTVWRKS